MLNPQRPDQWSFTDALSEGIYGVDRAGFCTFVNAAALRLLGYGAAEDLVGCHMHEQIHHTRPDGSLFPAAACPLLHTLTSGRPVRLDNELLWRKDGSSFVAEYSSYPIPGEDGAITGSVVTFVDRSATEGGTPVESLWGGVARREAEEALRASEARFRTMADSISHLAWMTGPDGSIDWYNRRWFDYTGTTLEQMRGWGWKSVHHPDHVDRVVEHINKAFAEGVPWEDTFPLRGRDGTFRWFLSRAVPIREPATSRNPQGRIVGWFGTNTDINDLRETEERLSAAMLAAEEANKAKSDFIANMSHELRTPLSAIIGYSEMMLEELDEAGDETGFAPDLRKVESNARHLLGLINDVLDLSKIESGRMEVFSERFAVGPMLRDIASTVTSLMERKSNNLVLEVPEDLGEMHSDSTKVRQVLLNLLSNAAKFTEGGTITLSAVRIEGPEQWLSFRVTDTGIGMTEEQLAKLFVRFTQADASTTRKFGGTGLGLAISKAFGVMLGGDIAVESALGQGTSFTLLVPAEYRERHAEDGADRATAGPDAEDGSDKGLVLVIDDDPSQQELIGRFLGREGFASRMATDGRTGLELARVLKPKVILLDVMMPGMDGWSVLSALKADQDLAAIPVIMVTFVDQRALAQSLGAADYVLKPVRWDRFKSVMDRFRPPETRALLIEDDPDTRTRMRTVLEADGWSVDEAANGAEGLERLDAMRPGIVLLDLVMPIMDGFAFLESMRARPDCATIPVVVLTSLDLTRADRRRLSGASQILNKGDVSLRSLGERLQQAAEAASRA